MSFARSFAKKRDKNGGRDAYGQIGAEHLHDHGSGAAQCFGAIRNLLGRRDHG